MSGVGAFRFMHILQWSLGGLPLRDAVPLLQTREGQGMDPYASLKMCVFIIAVQDHCTMSTDCLIIAGVREDNNKQAYTYVSDNRALAAAMDPADLALLRANKVTMKTPEGDVYKVAETTEWWWNAVDGPEDDPVFRLWEPVVLDQSGTITVGGGQGGLVKGDLAREPNLCGWKGGTR
jgi:hypothetical protein